MRQLRLANDFWNALVAIQREHEAAVQAVWDTVPNLAAARGAVQEAEAKLAEIREVIQKQKQALGSRGVSRELREAAGVAKAVLVGARKTLRVLKDANRERLETEFMALGKAKREAMKAARQEAAAKGLAWGTYNAVAQSFDVTCRLVAQRRAEGLPAEHKFHRFDGGGTWTVQLQREADDPPCTLQALLSGVSKWRNFVRIDLPDRARAILSGDHPEEEWAALTRGERRLLGKATLSIRVGSAENRVPVWEDFPINIHRTMPPDGEVKQVQVTRRRIGTQYRYAACFTVNIPGHVSPKDGPTVAVDLGWRHMEDDTLRVAVWKGDCQPAEMGGLPGWAEEFIRVYDDGRTGEIRLPAEWLAAHKQGLGLKALRDKQFNQAKHYLTEFVAGGIVTPEALAWGLDMVGKISVKHGKYGPQPPEIPAVEVSAATVPEWLRDECTTLDRWRSQGRLAALLRRWRDRRFPGDEAVMAVLEAWRQRDLHLYEWEANQRDQLNARRDEAYRVIAAALARVYAVVVTEDMNITKLRRAPQPEQEDGCREESARGQAHLAAPGKLRQILGQAFAKHGGRSERRPAAYTTMVHHKCGANIGSAVDFRKTVRVRCPVCEETFDQDINACDNLLEVMLSRQ